MSNTAFENLIKSITNLCRERKKFVTPALCAFITETLIDPDTEKFYFEDDVTSGQIRDIRTSAVQKLEKLSQTETNTYNLQIKHEGLAIDQDYFWTNKMQSDTEKVTSMIDQIIELKPGGAHNYDVLNLLYQRIFNYLIFKNKNYVKDDPQKVKETEQDPSLLQAMEKEVAAALESVIPRAALSPFIMLSNTEKVTQLTELNNLVLGIRLFNKEIGKGGETLSSMETLTNGITYDFLQEIKEKLRDAARLSTAYSNYFEFRIDSGKKLSEEDENAKSELVFLRQYTAMLVNLLDKVESSFSILETSKGRYEKEHSDLKNLLGSKSSAPKEQVYPKFAYLANSYYSIVEEFRTAKDKLEIYDLLGEIYKNTTFSLSQEDIERGDRHMEEKMSFEENEDHEIIAKNNVVYIESRHTPEFLQTPLDILGYCIVTLVDNEGVLIEGKHSLGVFRYNDENFVFRSIEDARKFVDKPSYYIDRLFELCRKIPSLILFLRVEEYFKDLGLRLIHIDPEKKGQSTKILLDFECQTEVHTEKFIDHNYLWNEWELRRKAIQMANIRNMMTKSTQTADSIFQVENSSQVWLMRNNTTQTGINNGNNPIRPRNYTIDLRNKAAQ